MLALIRYLVAVVLFGAIAFPLVLLASAGDERTGRQADGFDIERVRRVLIAQPEIVLEAIQTLQRREAGTAGGAAQDRNEAARRLIRAHAAALFNDPAAPVIGNPNGDVTIVEFFDYRCPYCKQAHETLAALMSADPGLRVIHKHFPILGPDSVIAARAALAARGQGRYGAYHDALMQSRSAYTEERVIATATAVGLDGTRLKAEMNDEILLGVLRENIALAQALGIRGTPTYVIGETLFFGVPEAATLRRLVAEARKKG